VKRWTAATLFVLVLTLGGAAQAAAPPTGGTGLTAVGPPSAEGLSWLLLAGFLVFFMQVGFAMVETGMARAKNAAHTTAMNVVVFTVGVLGFWACGYAVLHQRLDYVFLLRGDLTPTVLALFLFQVMFMDTAATIPTGALIERWKFLPFVTYSFFMSMVLYPVYAQWVWGEGWLARLGANFGLGHGHVDYAGSSVVHMVGGGAALVGSLMLGPRIGKYRPNGVPNPLPPHNIPLYMLGTLVLAFGWFGFNTGSALAAADPICARAAVNTALAGPAGAFAAMCLSWYLYDKPDPSFFCNGMLAGLVSVTAGCVYVPPWTAVLIGTVAGLLAVGSCLLLERRFRVDDPVGAVSVHLTNGVWGVLALGLFADGTYSPAEGFNGVAGKVTGLCYGNPGQLAAGCLGILANLLWVLPMSWLYFWAAGRLLGGNRVSPMVELQGLDVPELGALGYIPEDAKLPETRIPVHHTAEPRPAQSPPVHGKRFTVAIEGVEEDELMRVWSNLCGLTDAPSPTDFTAVYPIMTTVRDRRFSFRGGEPEEVRVVLERLFRDQLKNRLVQARLDKGN